MSIKPNTSRYERTYETAADHFDYLDYGDDDIDFASEDMEYDFDVTFNEYAGQSDSPSGRSDE